MMIRKKWRYSNIVTSLKPLIIDNYTSTYFKNAKELDSISEIYEKKYKNNKGDFNLESYQKIRWEDFEKDSNNFIKKLNAFYQSLLNLKKHPQNQEIIKREFSIDILNIKYQLIENEIATAKAFKKQVQIKIEIFESQKGIRALTDEFENTNLSNLSNALKDQYDTSLNKYFCNFQHQYEPFLDCYFLSLHTLKKVKSFNEDRKAFLSKLESFQEALLKSKTNNHEKITLEIDIIKETLNKITPSAGNMNQINQSINKIKATEKAIEKSLNNAGSVLYASSVTLFLVSLYFCVVTTVLLPFFLQGELLFFIPVTISITLAAGAITLLANFIFKKCINSKQSLTQFKKDFGFLPQADETADLRKTETVLTIKENPRKESPSIQKKLKNCFFRKHTATNEIPQNDLLEDSLLPKETLKI